MPKLHDLTPQEVNTMLSAHQAVLIDVREPGEFEAERIPGALHFPLSEFDPAGLPLDTKKRIILQCGSGKRSAVAAERLMAAAPGDTSHLKGGISAWKQAGLAVLKFDPATGKVKKTGG